MGSGLGLDNRELLPPFFPLLRNEDGLFGEALVGYDEDAFGAHVPRALLHSPPVRGRFEGDAIWRAPADVSLADVMRICLRSAPRRSSGEDPAARLRWLGEHLADLGGGSLETFGSTTRDGLLRQRCAYVDLLEAALDEHGGHPEYWAADVKRCIAAIGDMVSRPDWDLPRDVLPEETRQRRREVTRRSVERYGRLLQAWPVLIEAAQALHARAERLSASP